METFPVNGRIKLLIAAKEILHRHPVCHPPVQPQALLQRQLPRQVQVAAMVLRARRYCFLLH